MIYHVRWWYAMIGYDRYSTRILMMLAEVNMFDALVMKQFSQTLGRECLINVISCPTIAFLIALCATRTLMMYTRYTGRLFHLW